MKVLICGAGQVGFGIAERLAAENNDVSVIDSNPTLIQRISDVLDVRGFVGHGAHPDVLEQAGAREADMIIAVTFHDEVNMIACQVANYLFDIPTKIARIRSQTYLDPKWSKLFLSENVPIDVIISPENEVSEMVLKRLSLPGAFETASFGEGKIAAVGISCNDECPVTDTPLRQLTELFPDLTAVVVAIIRDGKLFVPSSEDQMLVGDDVYVIVDEAQVSRTLKIFGHDEKQARRVVIAGGGNTGLYVASRLEKMNNNVRVKIIEANQDQAIRLAEQLTQTLVLNGSALEEELLREADIANVDTMIALTNDDQVNILSSVLAKRLGCKRNLCLVNNHGYMTISRSLGIDTYINPRSITISHILQHVRRGRIRAVHSVHNGTGEILEAEALETSPMVGVPLRNLDLPNGVRIGAILRKGKLVPPNGTMKILANDRIVMFATAEYVRQVEQKFRVSFEYF
ncbi:MAG: Trk system potassium transporter TrkA [Methyloligellaceae bacterium]